MTINSKVNIAACQFSGLQANFGSGYHSINSTYSIYDSTFQKCGSTHLGGAIYDFNSTQSLINTTTFYNCYAYQGGALAFVNSTQFLSVGMIIQGCYAYQDGSIAILGHADMVFYATQTLENVAVIRCSIGINATGFVAFFYPVIFYDCCLYSNQATIDVYGSSSLLLYSPDIQAPPNNISTFMFPSQAIRVTNGSFLFVESAFFLNFYNSFEMIYCGQNSVCHFVDVGFYLSRTSILVDTQSSLYLFNNTFFSTQKSIICNNCSLNILSSYFGFV